MLRTALGVPRLRASLKGQGQDLRAWQSWGCGGESLGGGEPGPRCLLGPCHLLLLLPVADKQDMLSHTAVTLTQQYVMLYARRKFLMSTYACVHLVAVWVVVSVFIL